MQYYRCKCGKSEIFGSDSPRPCDKCDECGSDFAQSPNYHREPQEHNWHKKKVETDDGEKTLTVCRWCGINKKDLIIK